MQALALVEPAPAHSPLFTSTQDEGCASYIREADKQKAVVLLYSGQTLKCDQVSQRDLIAVHKNICLTHCCGDGHVYSHIVVQDGLQRLEEVRGAGHLSKLVVDQSKKNQKNGKHTTVAVSPHNAAKKAHI